MTNLQKLALNIELNQEYTTSEMKDLIKKSIGESKTCTWLKKIADTDIKVKRIGDKNYQIIKILNWL